MYLSFPPLQIQYTPHVHMAITGIGMACFHALQRKTPTSTSIQKMLELLYDKALEQLTPKFYNQGCERVMTDCTPFPHRVLLTMWPAGAYLSSLYTAMPPR